MFGNVIYFDNKKIANYSSIITKKPKVNHKDIEYQQGKSAGLSLPIGQGNLNYSKTSHAEIEESLLLECEKFENLLNGRDDYINFDASTNDITTVSRGYIVKFDSTIRIPPSFDMVQLIDQLKPMMLNSMASSMGTPEEEAMRKFFDTTNMKIPLQLELCESLLCAKIESQFLNIQYNELEEYEDAECTIIARVITGKQVDKLVPMYDPLKDFISMNRETRRRFVTNRPKELSELFSEEGYINIEILAIYQ